MDARLLVSSADNRVVAVDDDGSPSDSELVEIAHEALLRQWPPLYEVIEESRSALRLRADLERQHDRRQH